mgnify:FL=1
MVAARYSRDQSPFGLVGFDGWEVDMMLLLLMMDGRLI